MSFREEHKEPKLEHCKLSEDNVLAMKMVKLFPPDDKRVIQTVPFEPQHINSIDFSRDGKVKILSNQ